MGKSKDSKGTKKADAPVVQDQKSKKSKSKSSEKSLATKNAALDPTISSLFANSLGATKPVYTELPVRREAEHNDDGANAEDDDVDNDEELSEIEVPSDEDDDDDEDDAAEGSDAEMADADKPAHVATTAENDGSKRKRKRKDEHEDLEASYMQKLEREEEKALAKSKDAKRQKTEGEGEGEGEDGDDDGASSAGDDDEEDAASDAEDGTPPPMHESLLPDTTSDLAKSQRTVFLANVSTEAITSKSAQKTLKAHLSSFFSALNPPAKGETAHKLESIRFRSTAYASAIPKKAAFAKKELMDATTKSTNAYAIYSSQALAREAAKRLNGTVVLDRHIRVDEVAHPAKVDHKRCIFVGNLGFVDDESLIDKANEEEGKGVRKGKKTPSDIEEGLWRTFGTCGTVESVRVVRDSKTRVGKGFAYVQFADENAVEAALLYNEKKFPPMLPRKLRVSRAKAVKRNVKPGSSNVTKAPTHAKGSGVYNPKINPQQASQLGRAGKLMGRAAASQMRKGDSTSGGPAIRGPESFIFEGHRASAKQGKSGLKLGGKKKGGKPTSRSSKRGAQWKAGGGRNAK